MTTTATTTHRYEPITDPDISYLNRLIFVTPARHQGQVVEVSYSNGVPSGRGVNYDADLGDPYQRVVDHSDGQAIHFRLAK